MQRRTGQRPAREVQSKDFHWSMAVWIRQIESRAQLAADELREFIEKEDLVGGSTEGSGVVRYGVSMTWAKLRSDFARRRWNSCYWA